jgi:HlyD family secretion protein
MTMAAEAIPQSRLKQPATIGRFAKVRTAAWAYKWTLLACIVVIGLAGWWILQMLLGPETATDRAVRVTLVETVVATGSVQTPFRVTIGSQIVGTVLAVQVNEGQRVVKGQPLVSLENRELVSAVSQTQGALAEAEAHIRQLTELTLPTAHASLKQAQATLLNAQQTLGRAMFLVQKGDETRVALDAAQKDLDIARTQVRSAELAVFTASPGGSDFTTAQTQLNQAKANRESAVSRLGYATIVAPRDGLLIARNVEQGAVVQPGTTLLVLAPDGETQLLLAIDERNLGKLALGQKAVVSADAYANQRFSAVLSYINPSIDIARASVEVKLTVANPPAYLRQDMTVSVDIEVARGENALVLPGRSVHDALSDKPWVMVIRKGRAVRQPVRLGLQGATQTQILEGVADGESVLPAVSPILAGARVRPMPS